MKGFFIWRRPCPFTLLPQHGVTAPHMASSQLVVARRALSCSPHANTEPLQTEKQRPSGRQLKRDVLPAKILEQAHRIINSNADHFHDVSSKRCTLCDTALERSYANHASSVEHMSQLAVVERASALLSAHFAEVKGITSLVPSSIFSRDALARRGSSNEPNGWLEVILHKWWGVLNEAPPDASPSAPWRVDFQRMTHLSAPTAQMRLWRTRFLLRRLCDVGVLSDSLRIQSAQGADLFNRSKRFERCEMVGDSIIKAIVPDRLEVVFPKHEGGLNSRLALLHRLIDSNAGLIAIYDYLNFDKIIGVRLPNTKSKADVVESVFGELQMKVWAAEVHWGCEVYRAEPGCSDAQRATEVVRHMLNELAHMILMWRLELALRRGWTLVKEHVLNPRQQQQQQQQHGARKQQQHLSEGSYDRRAYDTLPILTCMPRAGGNTQVRSGGMEQWYYSRYNAVTHASANHEVLRQIMSSPMACPDAIRRHYRDAEHMRIRRDNRDNAAQAAAAATTQEETEPHSSSSSKHTVAASMGAMRYAAWREEAAVRDARQVAHTERVKRGKYLGPEEVRALMKARLDDGFTVAPTDRCRFPDLTSKPQPRRYTDSLAPGLTKDCLQLQWGPLL